MYIYNTLNLGHLWRNLRYSNLICMDSPPGHQTWLRNPWRFIAEPWPQNPLDPALHPISVDEDPCVIDDGWLLLMITDYHWLLMIIDDYCWLSLVVDDYCWLSLIDYCCKLLSYIHWCSDFPWALSRQVSWLWKKSERSWGPNCDRAKPWARVKECKKILQM